MITNIEKKEVHNKDKISNERYKIVHTFSSKIFEKYKPILSSMVINRSALSNIDTKAIKLLFVIDDWNNIVLDPDVSKLKIFASEVLFSMNQKLDYDTILASELWEGFKEQKLKTLDLVRESIVIKDNGFFRPLQDLLVKGKIRPSKESINNYYVKAEHSLKVSDKHLCRAVIDLYWAVTDSAHAAVMVAGITPPSPKELAETIKKELILRNFVHKRCADIISNIYDVAKKIMHKEIFEISGKQFDLYYSDAEFFIEEMTTFVKDHTKKNFKDSKL